MSSSSFRYAISKGWSIATLITSSVNGGSSLDTSSRETNAASSIRKSPKSLGDAPGRRFTCVVARALEHALSEGRLNRRDRLQDPIGFGKRFDSRLPPGVPAADHLTWIKTKQEIIDI